jgi:hypothetical protein
MHFATAKIPTPILNTPHFGRVFAGPSLPLDEQGLLRAVETVALPKTKFKIIKKHDAKIVQISTRDYPGENLFVDSRFLEPADESTPEREPSLPSQKLIVERLKKLVGTQYVWGGNWLGIPQMLHYYPPPENLEETLFKTWSFQGVDCSGLLYLACDGFTPRNTSQLITFGKNLRIAGLSLSSIQKLLQPLDLIVWKGHVLIVLNAHELIESRGGKGVVLSQTSERLAEIARDRKPASRWDDAHPQSFVINRWIT